MDAVGNCALAMAVVVACALALPAESAWAGGMCESAPASQLVSASVSVFEADCARAGEAGVAKTDLAAGSRISATCAKRLSAQRGARARKAAASSDKARRLPNGAYLIKPRSAPGEALGIEEASYKRNARVISGEMDGAYSRMFYFKYSKKDGCYAIVSVHSGLALTVSGSKVVQAAYKGAPSQRFKVRRGSGATYSLVAKSGRALLAEGAGKAVRAAKARAHTAGRSFKLVASPLVVPGIYELHSSKFASQVAGVKGSSLKAGAVAELGDARTGMGKTVVARAGSGYALRPLGSGAYLAASGDKVKQRAGEFAWNASFAVAGERRGIVFSTPDGKSISAKAAGQNLALSNGKGRAQAFVFKDTPLLDEGTYVIASPSGKLLGLKGGTYEDGGGFQATRKNGTSAQYFEIEKRNGSYVISSPRTFKALTSSDGAIVQKDYDGAASQQWRVFVNAQGRIVFQNRESGKMLGTVGKAKRGKANVGGVAFGSVGAGWALVARNDYSLTDNAELNRAVASILAEHGSLSSAFWYVANNYSFGGGWRLFNFGDVLSDEEVADYAWYMYSNGHGNCYRYAALFCALARGLDYKANVRIGYLRTTEQAHGWVEVEDGGTKVYDAEVSGAYADVGFVVDGISYERANAIAASFGEGGYNF